MTKWGCRVRYASVFFISLGFAVCIMSSNAWAGGVHIGFGVDASPGYVVPPPEVEAPPPPVVVERRPAPPPVVVERRLVPPPVLVERAPLVTVYEDPVVVERRSSVYYYYRPSYQYHSYRMETGREYYRYRSNDWADDDEY